MSKCHTKYVIVGAGLSGLTTAYQLLKSGINDFIILEGNNKIGGRINTENGIDLGATWSQFYHKYFINLLTDLEIDQFQQFSKGKNVLVHSYMAPAHIFETDSSRPQASRVSGGSMNLINHLAKGLSSKIKLNTEVKEVRDLEKDVELVTNKGSFLAEKVLFTVPPKLASQLLFHPELPMTLIEVMEETHTWMSNAIKVGISFEKPFWRDRGFSGTVVSQISPVTELYDHSNQEETMFSLMGFVHENMRDESPENRKEQILSYLEKQLGSEVRAYVSYYEKDWSKDRFTATEDLRPVYLHPEYGDPIFQDSYMGGKLYFSGTETSQVYGGYMEGAVYSGLDTVKRMIK